MAEANNLSQFNHPHLHRLIGVCFEKNDFIQIVTPLRNLGSLSKYLRENFKKIGPEEQISYCYQISSVFRLNFFKGWYVFFIRVWLIWQKRKLSIVIWRQGMF